MGRNQLLPKVFFVWRGKRKLLAQIFISYLQFFLLSASFRLACKSSSNFFTSAKKWEAKDFEKVYASLRLSFSWHLCCTSSFSLRSTWPIHYYHRHFSSTCVQTESNATSIPGTPPLRGHLPRSEGIPWIEVPMKETLRTKWRQLNPAVLSKTKI